jgi:folylpolyglutamate synthase/dihydropteroate synthase
VDDAAQGPRATAWHTHARTHTHAHTHTTPFQRVGILDDLSKLSIIHVAGTKGKGSTCAMAEVGYQQSSSAPAPARHPA